LFNTKQIYSMSFEQTIVEVLLVEVYQNSGPAVSGAIPARIYKSINKVPYVII